MVSFQEKNGEGLQKLQNYSEALEKINIKKTKEVNWFKSQGQISDSSY